MQNKKYVWILAAFLAVTVLSYPVIAQEEKEKGPSATVSIHAKEIGLLISGQKGTGVLDFEGEEHPFKLKGMDVGTIGKSETNAVGKVYNLDKLEDFEGVYLQGKASVAIKDGKAGAILVNRHGVLMRLTGDQEGGALSLGRGGIKVSFTDIEDGEI